MTTLLVTPAELAGGEVTVEGDAYRHLFRAKRLAAGDPLRVVDGAGRARHARIARVERRSARVELGEEAPSLEPDRQVELVVAPIRHQRAAWLVEKATELGVAAIRFVHTERVSHALSADGRARLDRMVAAAVQQCGRSRRPPVSGPHPWAELPALLAGAAQRLVLAPGGPSWAEAAATLAPPTAGRTVLLLGPEGGWSEPELSALRELECRPIGLGARTLRTETAALAAAALVLALPG